MDAQIPGTSLLQNDSSTLNISALAFAAKYKGKREIFNFLTIDVKAYLPAYETITVVSDNLSI